MLSLILRLARFLEEGDIDDCPMILSQFHKQILRKPFRFYNIWTKNDKFVTLGQYNWEKPIQGCKMYRVMHRLKWLKSDLKLLNKNGFNEVEADSKKFRKIVYH